MAWTPLRDPDGVAPKRVNTSLDRIMRHIGSPSGAAGAAVFTRWEEAVGAAVAVHARPLSLRGTTLVVAVDAPAYATQLRMLTPQLLARLGQIAGPGVIDGVEVRVKP